MLGGASGPSIIVPIETNMDRHPDHWDVWQDQRHHYACKPSVSGHGVYVILRQGIAGQRPPE
jgi:hypothetical protein